MKQIYIFDLDGTLYSENNPISKIIDGRIKDYIIKERNLTQREYNDLEQSVPDLLKALEFLKIDKKNFYQEVYANIDYKKYFCKNEQLIKNISRLKGKKIICSNSCEYHVKQVLINLGINELFDEIYCTDKFANKLDIYKLIQKKYNLLPLRIVVIGDNYDVDIQPAKTLGFKTIYINNNEISNIESAIKKILQEEEIK